VVEEVDGRLALLPRDGAAIVFLNESAALVWQLCDGRRTEAEVVELVEGLVTGVPAGSVGADVRTALTMLRDAGLLVTEPGT
jgi:hypothetical protein